MAQFFAHQTFFSPFAMRTDSDHAASQRERMFQEAYWWLEDVVSCQGIVSLSTGEAEYYSLVTGASNLLGEASTALDAKYVDHAEAFGRLSMWTPNTTGDKGVLPKGPWGSRKLGPTICWQTCLRKQFQKQRWAKHFWVWIFFPRGS